MDAAGRLRKVWWVCEASTGQVPGLGTEGPPQQSEEGPWMLLGVSVMGGQMAGGAEGQARARRAGSKGGSCLCLGEVGGRVSERLGKACEPPANGGPEPGPRAWKPHSVLLSQLPGLRFQEKLESCI